MKRQWAKLEKKIKISSADIFLSMQSFENRVFCLGKYTNRSPKVNGGKYFKELFPFEVHYLRGWIHIQGNKL